MKLGFKNEMVDKSIIEQIRNFFSAYRFEREDILQQNLMKTINNLASRNMLRSSIAGNDISRLYADELKTRSNIAWNSIQKVFEKRRITLSIDDANGINDEIKNSINSELKRLSDDIQSKLNNMNLISYMEEINRSLSSARNQAISKIGVELNFFISSAAFSKVLDTKSSEIKMSFINEDRINELKSISSNKFELTRLIQLCEEINVSHRFNSYMSIAMAIRAIIDHVPPIFDLTTFSKLANNYNGSKSFKDSMSLLNESLRKIADSHLHVQIRNKEILPTFNQVNFVAQLDVLLAEIVRVLK